MPRKPGKGRKIRVDFRPNRARPARAGDLTRRYAPDTDNPGLEDESQRQSVRAKGALSRKRTVIVGADEQPLVSEELWRAGTVTAVLGPACEVRDAQGQNWQCGVRRVLRTLLVGQRSAITCGDQVWFSPASGAAEAAEGVIERVAPRRNTLSRADFRGREHAIVANADQLLIISSVAEPNAKPHLIDRYLVAAARGDLRPILCFNKCDLAESAAARLDLEEIEAGSEVMTLAELIHEYERLGYTCLRTSVRTQTGIAGLRAALPGHISVLAGQSGVGKSSLANAIQPGLNLKIGAVSAENQKGRHTTSYTQLLPLHEGGFLVDTPGIRQFTLWSVPPGELEACFTEFARFIPDCRFKDCHHLNEAGCAVRAAAEDGPISPRRYASYCKMLIELAEERQERY